jgi:hypothetical protein
MYVIIHTLHQVPMAHSCKPSYSGGKRSGGSWLEASLGKCFTTPYLEKNHHKKRTGGVAQGVEPDFKPQYCKKKQKLMLLILCYMNYKIYNYIWHI